MFIFVNIILLILFCYSLLVYVHQFASCYQFLYLHNLNIYNFHHVFIYTMLITFIIFTLLLFLSFSLCASLHHYIFYFHHFKIFAFFFHYHQVLQFSAFSSFAIIVLIVIFLQRTIIYFRNFVCCTMFTSHKFCMIVIISII